MTERLSCSPLTCQLDGLAHLVTDEAAHAGRLARGTYRAVCGALVRATPMVVPAGPPCLVCEMLRSTRTSLRGGLDMPRRRHRRAGPLRRWLGYLSRPPAGMRSPSPDARIPAGSLRTKRSKLAGSVTNVLGALLALPLPACPVPRPRPRCRAHVVGPMRLRPVRRESLGIATTVSDPRGKRRARPEIPGRARRVSRTDVATAPTTKPGEA